MASTEERREHHRFRLWVPARIESASIPDSGLAVGHDMSQTGSLMVTRVSLPVGARIRLFVRIPPDSEAEREIGATVLRCQPNSADPNGLWPWEIAVVFDEREPELERLLRKHSAMLEGVSDTGEQTS